MGKSVGQAKLNPMGCVAVVQLFNFRVCCQPSYFRYIVYVADVCCCLLGIFA